MNHLQWGLVCARAAAALALATGLVACQDDDGVYAPTTTTPAARMTLAAKTDSSYGVARASSGATIEVYRNSSGAVTQGLYTNTLTGERVRAFNGSDGLPDRVLDERSGNTLTITRTSTERVDYRAYSSAGAYLGGYALLSRADGFYVGTVTGTPSFSGQIAAQMTGTTLTGSFSMLPTSDAGLGTLVPVSATALAFANGTRRVVASQATAQQTTAAQATASAIAIIDAQAVVGGLVAGALLTGNGSWAPALIGGGAMAFALQASFLPVFDSQRDAASLEQLSDTLNTFLDRFDRGFLAITALNDTLSGAISARARNALRRAFDTLLDIVSALVDRTTLAALTATAPAGPTTVAGFGVDQSGMNYTLDGTVSATGSLTATATPADNGAKIIINGNITGVTLTGTISGRLGNGTVTGTIAALGQCAVLTQSGGQGTFSYAFDAGVNVGTFEFYRNAYSIPDGFRVLSNGQTLYDTGGLVSGIETKVLTLAGSRTVFVLVNAPNSGTAWDFRLGCPA